jgi:hypothetical protein
VLIYYIAPKAAMSLGERSAGTHEKIQTGPPTELLLADVF